MTGAEPALSVEVIERYDRPVPRYTSYPTVPFWTKDFGPEQYRDRLEAASRADGPLSIYVHIPFCIRRCLFCTCNVLVNRDPAKAERYVELVAKELALVADALGKRRRVSQFHLGGGTPTHLAPALLKRLAGAVRSHFDIPPGAEKSLEVHPSVTTADHLSTLAELGFNRISMGVQDFDENVQRRINRHQTFEETAKLVADARALGFGGVNFDLIYGLPFQTKAGLGDSMKKVIGLRPDRLAVYSFAYLPEQEEYRHQRGFPPEKIPKGKEKMALFLLARDALVVAGYRTIGFDHFALPGDELWRAHEGGTLRRNFMGYSTQAGTDMVALGVTAISDVQAGYAQNAKSLDAYREAVEAGRFATQIGCRLDRDDEARREAIMGWLCRFRYSPESLRRRFGADSAGAIRDGAAAEERLIAEGLIEREAGGWRATWPGRMFGRVVASVFDRYLRMPPKKRYSSAV